MIKTTESFTNLNDVAQKVLTKARKSGMFFFVDSDLKLDKPQATVTVDRDKIAALGLQQADIGQSLGAALGGGYVNYFSIQGRSYKVIPQVLQTNRLNPDQVLDYYIRASNGTVVPASTVASITTSVVPESINHFQQLNSATISGVSGASDGDVLKFLKQALEGSSTRRLRHRLRRPITPVHQGIGRLRHHAVYSPSSSCSWRWPRSSRAFAIRS